MRRREFITLLGGAATWPLAARGQQPKRVATLIHSTADDAIYQSRVAGFQRSLRSLGWIEGKNLQLDIRWDGLDPETTHRHAVELATLAPDVILTSGTAGLAGHIRKRADELKYWSRPMKWHQATDCRKSQFGRYQRHSGHAAKSSGASMRRF
jgi:hypothetical protein